MQFQIDQVVTAMRGYRLHHITPGNDYQVRTTQGGQIMVTGDNGINRWVPSQYFTAKPKVKAKFSTPAAQKKMTFEEVHVGRFIVGSLSKDAGFSSTKTPKAHLSEDEAKAECARLSGLDPKKKYVYLQIAGACQSTGVQWEPKV